MAQAVLSVTLQTLRDLLLEESRFLSGVSNQVKEIQGQLEIMKSFLEDADERQHKEKTVRTWVEQVRRLAFRTEDVLETYAVEVVSKRKKGIKTVVKRFACILSEGKALHKVGEEIANIKSEITNLNTSRITYGINDLNEGESSKEAKEKERLLRQTYSNEVEKHFVGMKDDIQELVSLLTEDDQRDHPVISIWGMGGLGKTTLARNIFNHRMVQRSFDAFAWVCITQQCQFDKVLQDLLKQILGKDMHGDQTALVRELHKVLKEKKCLVVLDDIWKPHDWEILCPAFPLLEANSKILLTTREREVAKRGLVYALKHLTEEEGWELLWRKALNKPDQTDLKTFEHVGKEVVRNCRCLPLAISVLGGILREKSSLREWQTVNEHIDLYLRRGEGHEEANGLVLNVLGLSYNELPYYLKPCFLYMGRFQEDETIFTEKLYHLWVAEGLVLSKHCEEEETMMDVAARYLNELASRCMVEVEMYDTSIIPRIESFRLHDLIRDLCLAKGKEENFFKVIDLYNDLKLAGSVDLSSHSEYGRRLGMYIHKQFDSNGPQHAAPVKLCQPVQGQYLRTLFVCSIHFGRLDLQDISCLKKFKLLRVLDLTTCQFDMPKEISQLIHLRYLSLHDAYVEKLPSTMSSLPYLQTLDLRTNCEIYLPNIFWKMKRLKHIYLKLRARGSEKLQFKDLSQLETLHGFSFSEDEPIDLKQLVNLRSFSGLVNGKALSQHIDQIYSWEKIKQVGLDITGSESMSEQDSAVWRKLFSCEYLNDLYIESPIAKFPPYEPEFCPNLTRFELAFTKIEEDPMLFLSKLPKLRQLILGNRAFVGKEMVCDAMAFPQLTYLQLCLLPNLETWRVDEGALPNLSDLTIGLCPKLETITDGLNFSALKDLHILEMPEEFKQKYYNAV